MRQYHHQRKPPDGQPCMPQYSRTPVMRIGGAPYLFYALVFYINSHKLSAITAIPATMPYIDK
jgi:hypothetical protein